MNGPLLTEKLVFELVNDNQDTIEYINIFSSSLPLNHGDFFKIMDIQLLAHPVTRFLPDQNHPGPARYPGSMHVHIPQRKQVCKKSPGSLAGKYFFYESHALCVLR